MKKRVIVLAAFSMGLAGCATDEAGTECVAPLPMSMPSIDDALASLDGLPFDEFIEASYEQLLRRFPQRLTALGMAPDLGLRDDRLNDVSDAYRRQTIDLVAGILTRLEGYDRSSLTAQQQISYDSYAWFLRDWRARRDVLHYEYLVATIGSAIHRELISFMTKIHPVTNQEQARDYIARLRQVSLQLARVREGLRTREQMGVVPPKVLLDTALPEIRSIAQGEARQVPFYTSFAEKLDAAGGMDEAAKAALLDEAATAIDCHVIPAYEALQDQVETLARKAPAQPGVGQFDGGNAYYEYALRHHTTTDMTADEIHQLGLDEMARIRAEMEARFEMLGYSSGFGGYESLEARFTAMAADSGHVRGEAAIAEYEAIIAAAESKLGEAFEILPEAEVVVIGGSSGGYYVEPSPDGSRPGAFYAYTDGAIPRYDMASLAYHEAVPGHHLQIALAQEMAELPTFRKFTNFTSYVEGWALYAERLAADLGWYEGDAYGDLGRLQFEAFRVARLVVDTGIHAKGWSFDDAVSYIVENVGYSRSYAEWQVIRYTSWPAQATAYKIGMEKILELRQRAMDALGEDFDLRAFHTAVLGAGSMPLDVLDELVQRYINDTAAAPQRAVW